MCTHQDTVIMKCHHIVCTDCGVICGIECDPSKMQLYEDYKNECLLLPYTRLKRFKNLVDSIVFGFETSLDRKMLSELDANNANSLKSIIGILNNSKLVDKRYCSLHLFLNCFAPKIGVTEITPDDIRLYRSKEKEIDRLFKRIEGTITFIGKPCINYKFLLDVILDSFKLDQFRVFIKPMVCKKRIQRHIDLLNEAKIKCHDGTFFVIPETYEMSPKSLFRSPVNHGEIPFP